MHFWCILPNGLPARLLPCTFLPALFESVYLQRSDFFKCSLPLYQMLLGSLPVLSVQVRVRQERLAWASRCFGRRHAGRYVGRLSGEFWSETASCPMSGPLLIRQGAGKRESPCSHTLKLTKCGLTNTGTSYNAVTGSPSETRDHRVWWLRELDIHRVQRRVWVHPAGLGMEMTLRPAWPGLLSMTWEPSLNSEPKCIMTEPMS